MSEREGSTFSVVNIPPSIELPELLTQYATGSIDHDSYPMTVQSPIYRYLSIYEAVFRDNQTDQAADSFMNGAAFMYEYLENKSATKNTLLPAVSHDNLLAHAASYHEANLRIEKLPISRIPVYFASIATRISRDETLLEEANLKELLQTKKHELPSHFTLGMKMVFTIFQTNQEIKTLEKMMETKERNVQP